MKAWHFIGILLPLLGCSHGSPAVNDNDIQTKSVPHPLPDSLEVENQTEKTHPTVHIDKLSGRQQTLKAKIMLDVPLIRQNPELKYGCEVTSLAMVLQYGGANTNKMELYQKIKKDTDPLKRSGGDILSWGNPAEGFVGDMTGRRAGYAVFDRPMIDLINHYFPGRAVNLTGRDFHEVLAHVSAGYPAVVWTTGDYRLPDRWESWTHGSDTIKTPLDLHAVVLVGYDQKFIYLNDPLSGKKQVPVRKQQFIRTWKAMNSRAVSYQ
jgi:uncharacterized protein YvpB